MNAKIDYKEITRITDFMEEKNLAHFELEIEGFKIKLSRNPNLPSSGLNPLPLQASPEPKMNETLPIQELPAEKDNHFHLITSPMVGTFYRAPDPSSAPFVEVGDTVKKNQTLCIIEAMKLMNEIESEVDGILEEIYVENGMPVEYGQKLFAIRPLS